MNANIEQATLTFEVIVGPIFDLVRALDVILKKYRRCKIIKLIAGMHSKYCITAPLKEITHLNVNESLQNLLDFDVHLRWFVSLQR